MLYIWLPAGGGDDENGCGNDDDNDDDDNSDVLCPEYCTQAMQKTFYLDRRLTLHWDQSILNSQTDVTTKRVDAYLITRNSQTFVDV